LAYLLDTNVAIHLRDGEPEITRKVAGLDDAVLLSIITRVELEGGVYRDPDEAGVRRALLNVLLGGLPVMDFDAAAAEAYGGIVAAAGHSRRKLLDRMIAAQALVHRAVLVTLNPDDFRDVPGLQILAW
jgi:predicted nucleic acid-binding protein